jgi:hypothetical protein
MVKRLLHRLVSFFLCFVRHGPVHASASIASAVMPSGPGTGFPGEMLTAAGMKMRRTIHCHGLVPEKTIADATLSRNIRKIRKKSV